MSLINYSEPVRHLLRIGESEDPWPDYIVEYGITQADIPALIDLVNDRDLRFEEAEPEPGSDEFPPEFYAQMHAWRVLGQLRSAEAIPTLIDLLEQIDLQNDEYYWEEAAEVFALIGPPAITPLSAYLADPMNQEYARITAGESLTAIAKAHPETRQECIEAISGVLENFQENFENINGFLVLALARLKAVDKIGLIEQAFQAGRVEEFVMGDFEDVQVKMGLLAERITPKVRNNILDLPQSSKSTEDRSADKAYARNEKKEKAKRKQAKKSRKKNQKKKGK